MRFRFGPAAFATVLGLLGCAPATLLAQSAVVAIVMVGAASPAVAAPVTVVALHGDTAVRAFGGVQVWSDFDVPGKRWRVMVRRNGQVFAPAIPAAKDPIEVDVGPGLDGSPVLAYVSCTGACRVIVARLNGGTLQIVPGSAGASHPTIWGRQVAWVRGAATVMTSPWAGHGRMVLAGAPRRRCYRPFGEKPRCEHPQRARVDDLELRGSQLALVDTFVLTRAGGSNGVAEVRTESTRGGAQRLVALMDVGEGGQTWIGPSWAKGKLFFYKTCLGDSGGCVGGAGGAFAFDPARDSYVHANESTVLSGFAIDDDGRRAYEAIGPGDRLQCGEVDAPPCLLRQTEPLAFKATRSQVREP